MSVEESKVRELLGKFFDKVCAPDSIPGGILQATRPNDISGWNEEEDTRRNKQNAASFIENTEIAIERLATRKP